VHPPKNFSEFYGTLRCITIFQRAHHQSLSQTNPIDTPHSISQRSILILFTHLHLCLLIGLFPSVFPTNNICILLTIHVTCPAHLIVHDLINLILTSCHVISPGPNIPLSTLFSNTLSLCSSLNDRTTGKIIVLRILMFTFLGSRKEDKRFWTEC
jgi:hypothetical protein